MSVIITNRAKKNIRNLYWRSSAKSIQRNMETQSLLDAMLKLVNTTPLTPSKECRGHIEYLEKKGNDILVVTKFSHYWKIVD